MTTFSINEFYEKIKEYPWIDVEYPTHKYAIEVVTGERIACKWEKLSCERHLRDLLRQNTEEFPYVFDYTRSNMIFNWFSKRCTHVKGIYSGQPIELVAFQKYDLGCLFGWVTADKGYRRFNYSFEEIARGHAKSTKESGIATFFMAGDCYYPPFHHELRRYDMSPNVYCAGYDRNQAKIVWNDACMMGQKSPKISKDLDIKKTMVTNKKRGGEMVALSRETKNKDGLSVSLSIIDEYHAHRTSDLYDVIRSALGKRVNEMVTIITTAGNDSENNPCLKEEELCKKILTGEIVNEKYFVNIRQLDKDDDPHDERNWAKANPMLLEIENGNEYAQGLYEKIKTDHDMAYGSNDYGKIREFLTKRCNVWQQASDDMFMEGCMDKFKSLAVDREEFLEMTEGLDCIAGIDLSKATDLTAAAYVFRLANGKYALTAHGYIAEERAVEHEKTDRVPYLQWAKEGYCTLTEGSTVDYSDLVDDVLQAKERYGWNIKELTYDPYAAEYCTQDIEKGGITRVKVPQRMATLSEPTKFFKKIVLEGNLVHDGSPLLTWCVSNAVAKTDDQENIMLSKKNRTDTQRIDLLAASINAFSRAITVLKPKKSILYVPKRRKSS